MILYFDDGENFDQDLQKMVSKAVKWEKPVIVLPTDSDVNRAQKLYSDSKITFISYEYWVSKKWIADDNYDHIDFFRIEQFLLSRSFGVKVGCATMKRTKKKEVKEELK